MFCKSELIGILVVALIGTSCATTPPPPYNPFKVSQEQIYAKTKTIGLALISVPDGIPDAESVKVKFESLLEAKLREAGFLTVPSNEFAETWKRMTEQVGGYFDPISGKRDESKLKAVRHHTYRELSTKFNVDAFLYSYIRVFTVNWSGTMAHWHGASESIMPTGQQVLEAFAGISRHGTVPALSLTVSFQDTNGVNLYLNSGGIQLVSKLSGSKFVSVPLNDLFINEERNRNAVNIALEPLIKREVPVAPEIERKRTESWDKGNLSDQVWVYYNTYHNERNCTNITSGGSGGSIGSAWTGAMMTRGEAIRQGKVPCGLCVK